MEIYELIVAVLHVNKYYICMYVCIKYYINRVILLININIIYFDIYNITYNTYNKLYI